jgi:hypothetical protein
MDAITQSYLNMRSAARPQPKLGQRVGFLSESASEQFLTEYNRLRDANLIVPSALVPTAVGGQMLCEAVESPILFEDRMREVVSEVLQENDEELDEVDLRVIDRLPDHLAEVARDSGMGTAELVVQLLNPTEDQREAAADMLEAIVGEVADEVHDEVLAECEAEAEIEELVTRLHSIEDEAELDAAFAALSEAEVEMLDAFLTVLDEEQLDELSPERLGDYIAKAGSALVRHGYDYANPKPKVAAKAFHNIIKRETGIRRAVRKMAPKKNVTEGVQVFSSFDEWRAAVRVARGGDVEFRRVLNNGQLGDTRAFLNGKMLSESWDGSRGYLHEDTESARTLSTHYRGSESDEPTMALKHQPKAFRRTLKDILQSGFKPGSAGDRAFAALHKVERWDDANGNDDAVFNGSNVKQSSRSPRYGYKAGEDAQHYDDLKERSPILESATTPSARMRTSNTPWAIPVLSGLRPRN